MCGCDSLLLAVIHLLSRAELAEEKNLFCPMMPQVCIGVLLSQVSFCCPTCLGVLPWCDSLPWPVHLVSFQFISGGGCSAPKFFLARTARRQCLVARSALRRSIVCKGHKCLGATGDWAGELANLGRLFPVKRRGRRYLFLRSNGCVLLPPAVAF